MSSRAPPVEHGVRAGRDTAGPFRVVTEEQARAFDEQGFFVLEDAFDAETVDAVGRGDRARSTSRCSSSCASSPTGRLSLAGVDTVSIALHLVGSPPALREFCASPLFADLCHDLIGPDVRLYWDQAVYKQPHGAEPVLWHQDNGYTYVEPQAYLTCWVAITDATPDNGCVWVLPGVHRAGTLAPPCTRRSGSSAAEDPDGAVEVPVRAREHRRVLVAHAALRPATTAPARCARPTSCSSQPDGAVALRGDPDAGPGRPEPQDDPDRQFFVLRGGASVGEGT